MNVSNVRATLTTAITSMITSGDVNPSPINVALLVRDFSDRLASDEALARQFNADQAENNAVALAVKNGKPVVQP
jgi:hypothetical protein